MDSFPSPASAADGFSSLNAGIFFDDARCVSRCAPVSARREGAAEPFGCASLWKGSRKGLWNSRRTFRAFCGRDPMEDVPEARGKRRCRTAAARGGGHFPHCSSPSASGHLFVRLRESRRFSFPVGRNASARGEGAALIGAERRFASRAEQVRLGDAQGCFCRSPRAALYGKAVGRVA